MKQIVNSKACIDCGCTKDFGDFYCRKDSKDGHHGYCKACHNKRNTQAAKKWLKTESGREYARLASARNRCLDKWKEYNRNYSREYQKTPKGLEQRRAIDKRKRLNPTFRVNSNMSRIIRKSLELKKGGRSWFSLVDYTLSELIAHLQSKFTPEMNWGNYGSYWHIDHIMPRSSFHYNSFEDDQFKKCWSLSNLQPLEAKENIRKSNKIFNATSSK